MRYPALGAKTMAVVDRPPPDADRIDWITSSQVEEAFAESRQHELLVFPLGAIGRGTNIVFTTDPRRNQAALGMLYFLTRPHPAGDDTGLLVSLAGHYSELFDTHRFAPGATIGQMMDHWHKVRREAYAYTHALLNNTVQFRTLGPLRKPFVANVMIDILQTIGRAMRGGCACRVFFVDAAWAPQTVRGGRDTPETSMLLTMREVLREAINDADPVHAQMARELYEPFYAPLSSLIGVNE